MQNSESKAVPCRVNLQVYFNTRFPATHAQLFFPLLPLHSATSVRFKNMTGGVKRKEK